MIDKEEIDVVVIATEIGYYPEIAIYCMNKKKHVIHVIVEKLMALSIENEDKVYKR